ncbi:MAG TPA: sigma-70 family RNA polymerase sigma factor [Pyrinomonadaceae bacterium]|nr:sigma-70 family RNA polymerase sigma factor [Pyrinomonadaceae bacterium]
MHEFQATADSLLMPVQRKAPVVPVAPAAPGDLQTAGAATAVGLETEESRESILVRKVLAGERDQFGQLYKLYAPLVHGVLLARMPRSEVEDMVQDIFLHALKKLDTLRDANAFGPWVAMIARNRAMDFHRRSRETVEITDDLRGSESSGSKAEEILAIIRALPDAYRETLVLRLVEGMTGPEIATRTGMTAASVRVNLHRGMKLLRTKLGVKEGL